VCSQYEEEDLVVRVELICELMPAICADCFVQSQIPVAKFADPRLKDVQDLGHLGEDEAAVLGCVQLAEHFLQNLFSLPTFFLRRTATRGKLTTLDEGLLPDYRRTNAHIASVRLRSSWTEAKLLFLLSDPPDTTATGQQVCLCP
jgi:hypothetical protein